MLLSVLYLSGVTGDRGSGLVILSIVLVYAVKRPVLKWSHWGSWLRTSYT